MTSEVLSGYAQVETLQVSELVTYLSQNQWLAVTHLSLRMLVVEKGVDDQGKPIQIVLPSKDDNEDKLYLLAKAVNLLSFLESMPFRETVNAINDASMTISAR